MNSIQFYSFGSALLSFFNGNQSNKVEATRDYDALWYLCKCSVANVFFFPLAIKYPGFVINDGGVPLLERLAQDPSTKKNVAALALSVLEVCKTPSPL